MILIVNTNAVTPELSVAISSPADRSSNFVAPASIELIASVEDDLGPIYSVSFYAGAEPGGEREQQSV